MDGAKKRTAEESASTADHYDDPRIWLPRLERTLQEQTALAERLGEMSARQTERASAGDAPAVLAILREREPVIAQMLELSARIEPFARNMKSLLAALSPDARERLTRQIAALDETVATVNRRDESDRRVLEEHRKSISDELSGVSKARGALSAYGEPGKRSEPVYQDREG